MRPADPERSLIVHRIEAADALGKMPPLARNVVDARADKLVQEWVSAMTPPAQLAKPWIADDIGSVAQPGDTTLNAGVYTIVANGSDIWDTADAFHFASQPLKGNGQIIARVTSISDGESWEKAGVMIRGGPHPGASTRSWRSLATRAPAFNAAR